MTYYLFLDDERYPGDFYQDKTVVIARSYDQFVEIINQRGETPAHISFDHDLGQGATGADCAKYLLDAMQQGVIQVVPIAWDVHSQNPVGAENIHNHMNHLMKFVSLTGGE